MFEQKIYRFLIKLVRTQTEDKKDKHFFFQLWIFHLGGVVDQETSHEFLLGHHFISIGVKALEG